MKHKHEELIKAWADGAEIQTKIGDRYWFDCEPKWWSDREYRIKPTPKPDVERGMYVVNYGIGAVLGLEESRNNLKMTFDGETGELKSAEVLK